MNPRLIKINEEVFRTPPSDGVVSYADLRDLVKHTHTAPRGRARICTHQSDNDALQEMFICLLSSCYIRPHKHQGKVESMTVLEGVADLVFFDDAGKIVKHIELGGPESGLTAYHRLSVAIFHSLIVRTPHLLIHEVTSGPFVRGETGMAPWSPEEGDAAGRASFIKKIAEELKGFSRKA